MSLSRRGLLGGLIALAAPAIIRTPGLLMPVRRYVVPASLQSDLRIGDEFIEITGFGLPPIKLEGATFNFDRPFIFDPPGLKAWWAAPEKVRLQARWTNDPEIAKVAGATLVDV